MQPQSWALLRAASTIYADDQVLVLNKPAGLSVTGERHDTDLVELAREAGEELFPAHRIDKVTSGVIVLARTLAAHGGITRQFNRAAAERPVGKVYLAMVAADDPGPDGPGSGGSGPAVELPEAGTIDLPLGPGRKGRIRVAAPRDAIRFDPDPDGGLHIGSGAGRWSVPADTVTTGKAVYPSVTTFVTLWEGGGRRLLAVTPVTGRRHQIRVHLAWIGHAIMGDPLFEREPAGRTLLHAWRLALDASWADGRRLHLEATPGPDFLAGLPDPATPVAPPAWDGTGLVDALARLEARTLAAGTGHPDGTGARAGRSRRGGRRHSS